ncbi:MAG: heavy metal translocating P-type ATPase [Suipraeoptans sp.]
MKFIIKHDIKGRLRIHTCQKDMSYEEADTLHFYLQSLLNVTNVKVYERTGDAVIYYNGDKEYVLQSLKEYGHVDVDIPPGILEYSGRALNSEYQDKMIAKLLLRGLGVLFVPMQIRTVWTIFKSAGYILKGVRSLAKKKLEVEVLDATAITVSLIRGNFATASSVMFMLGVGELLEEWTHKRSATDLAMSMSLNIKNVWIQADGKEALVPYTKVIPGDKVVVRMGNVIPFDGTVKDGVASVNQASLTGESEPVKREKNGYVYAGTVIEEGELVVEVKEAAGSTRYEKIMTMIEDTEALKSNVEGKASRLADRLVPFTLLGTLGVGLITRNVTKALAVLMVDYSCALKLAMPISVLSAIKEANFYRITVKGGKFLEMVADADTVVFDKTGTLTKAQPIVKEVISFGDNDENEMLRVAACLEEHFPHSMAKAVVKAANDRGLEHAEMHSKVNYVVAHGISTTIEDKKAIIGSAHFVFDDEKTIIPKEAKEKFDNLPQECSHLYLAIEGVLKAVICIEDELREEASAIITSLKKVGIKKIVMMTGDSERTAGFIANKLKVDEYYSEVLPEDKARFVSEQKENGSTVIMIGDGINDSPALSAADVGIAISDGAEIAREIADITISADDLYEIVTLKLLSDNLMKRIQSNYREIVGINTGLIVLGVAGVITPTTSALLHNLSTLSISVKSMNNLIS